MSVPMSHTTVVSASRLFSSMNAAGFARPHPDPLSVRRGLQGVERRPVEAPAAVAEGGRIGNPLGAQRVEASRVVPPRLEVLQPGPAAGGVVRDPGMRSDPSQGRCRFSTGTG
jgi:hypothetical protein